MRHRALAIYGDRGIVIETDEDGETEEMLAPLWQDVSDALLYAAMARARRNTWTRGRGGAHARVADERGRVALMVIRGRFSSSDPHPA